MEQQPHQGQDNHNRHCTTGPTFTVGLFFLLLIVVFY